MLKKIAFGKTDVIFFLHFAHKSKSNSSVAILRRLDVAVAYRIKLTAEYEIIIRRREIK